MAPAPRVNAPGGLRVGAVAPGPLFVPGGSITGALDPAGVVEVIVVRNR
jgi:hypothetical protein